ncbi:alpha/beta hydrolase [Flavihumibacter petaseus]|uniref:Putative esterase n=1 Tax=Flavihumibacter petaseus NBRC 106054 TaxID=1220578 RepID=A0A0E9N0I9_9BACT|nr:alpha/beta hydrolase family protein [Flavihumibacter petaseus]GAO43517.1 putative esterase [Flavihumibacter petaseus NBRC 106054]
MCLPRFSSGITLMLVFWSLLATAAPVDTVRVYSHALNRNIPAVVIQPRAKAPDEGFPILYLLHGFGGNYALWINKVPQLQDLCDKYGCIIVCPDGGRTTLYFDNPFDTTYQFETHFIRELMPWVESHYPVRRDRQFRAISGLSMGGFGAFYLASRHADLFGAAGSMSGALNVDALAQYSTLGRKDTTCCRIRWNAFATPEKVALAMECGTKDYLLAANRTAHQKLLDLGIPHDYTERPGKHEWEYWQNAIRFQLLFFRNYWDNAENNSPEQPTAAREWAVK